MAELKTLNGYEIVDQTARDRLDKLPSEDIENLLIGTKTLTSYSTNDTAIYELTTSTSIDTDTGFTIRHNVYNGSGIYNYLYYGNIEKIIPGETYTFSFKARGTIKVASIFFYGPTGYVKCEKSWGNDGQTNNDSDGNDGKINITITESWKEYIIHWTLKDSGNAYLGKRLCVRSDNSSAGWFEFYSPKLQLGKEITTYSQSPLDKLNFSLSGSATPDSSIGRDGDIYIMY